MLLCTYFTNDSAAHPQGPINLPFLSVTPGSLDRLIASVIIPPCRSLRKPGYGHVNGSSIVDKLAVDHKTGRQTQQAIKQSDQWPSLKQCEDFEHHNLEIVMYGAAWAAWAALLLGLLRQGRGLKGVRSSRARPEQVLAHRDCCVVSSEEKTMCLRTLHQHGVLASPGVDIDIITVFQLPEDEGVIGGTREINLCHVAVGSPPPC